MDALSAMSTALDPAKTFAPNMQRRGQYMTEYDTPSPIQVVLDLVIGSVRITASDTTTTTVSVRPGDPAKNADVRAANEVRVDYSDGVLSLHAPKNWRYYTWRGGSEHIDIDIAVPAGSRVQGETSAARLSAEGRLDSCAFRTGAGDIRVEQAGRATLHTGTGSLQVGRLAGPAELSNGSGSIRAGTLEGEATVKVSSGNVALGEVTGPLTAKSSYGDVVIEQLHGSAEIKCAYGDVRIDRVGTGEVRVDGGYGGIEIGVPEGTATWLDASSSNGEVNNHLDTASAPGDEERTVAIIARTNWGSIAIRRPLR